MGKIKTVIVRVEFDEQDGTPVPTDPKEAPPPAVPEDKRSVPGSSVPSEAPPTTIP